MKKLILLLSGILIAFFLYSCGESSQSNIDNETFVQIYCDVVSTSDLVEVNKRQALRDSILHFYGFTYEDFQKKLSELKNQPEKWKEIYDKIIEELEKRVEEAEKYSKKLNERKPELKPVRPIHE